MIKAGQILNDTYEIIERLGSGAGGIIFKAYHRRMQKYVAIKLIKDDIKEKLNNRSEVDVLKNLKNDYLPQVHDFIEDGGEVYTVMEFIEGQNFKQIITGGRKFDEKSVRKYALQLCEAVEYLHSHQPPIIHSDIKPSNIMLTPQDKICLIDFNISMVTDNGIAAAAGGSRGFAAPEQFKRVISAPVTVDDFHEETRFLDNDETEILSDNEQTGSRSVSIMQTKDTARAFIDIRTDIYGIGASVYYMLTSRIPVGGQLDFRGIHCSAQIRKVIAKAMNPNPSKRYRNVTELKKALRSGIGTKMIIVSAAAVCVAALSVAVVSSGVLNKADKVPENFTATQTVTESAKTTATEKITTTEAKTVAVPSLVGLSESEAIEACTAAGLKYYVKSSESDTVEKGIVASQVTAADTHVRLGYKVVFTVSEGKTEKSETSLETTVTETTEPKAEATADKSGIISENRSPDTIIIKGKEYSTDMTGTLSLIGKNLSNDDISDLRYMKKLNEIILNNNNITDLSVLSELTNLQKLTFHNNNVSDISFVKNLTNLTVFGAGNNGISDISPLSELTNLNEVWVYNNKISDISALKNCTKIKYAGFADNQISDFTPLTNCTGLIELNVSNNNLNGNFESIRNLTILDVIYVSGNNFTDEKAIERFINSSMYSDDDGFTIYW